METVIFRNNINGYTVFEAYVDEEIISLVGETVEIFTGEEFSAQGRYASHPVYGRQFQVEALDILRPSTKEAAFRFLSAGAIHGIGPVLAKRITDKFGELTFEVLERSPEKLSSVKGITNSRAEEIVESFRNITGLRSLVGFLMSHEIKPASAISFWKEWGQKSLEVIRDDPYSLCRIDMGISFLKADSIAAGFGMNADEPCRVGGGILHVLTHNLNNGHVCLPINKLVEASASLLQLSFEAVEGELLRLEERTHIIIEMVDGCQYIYLPEYHRSEVYVSQRLKMMSALGYERLIETTQEDIEKIETDLSIRYAQKQREAIFAAIKHKIVILTGGPGTGKTTALNGIIALLEKHNSKIALCAPTGRAAKRLSEVTGKEAKTIHRLLEADFLEGVAGLSFKKNDKNLLAFDAIIVDEMSMVDVRLFEALLRACKSDARLILVGDPDQLPPVGPGNVIRDLINSNCFVSIHLKEIFRQAQKSAIVVAAHHIVNGARPRLDEFDSDLFYLPRNNPKTAVQTVLDLYLRRLPLAYKLDATKDIQIITPTRIGVIGTENLNRAMQLSIFGENSSASKINSYAIKLHVGDKVMHTKNNYNIGWVKSDGEYGLGIYNGDIGFVAEINRRENSVKIEYDDRIADYSFEQLNELELAYAITVHKSQGSEFDTVILPLFGRHKKLHYRNLLYTAVTRAKKRLIIVGEKDTVYYMIDNERKSLRYTNLTKMIQRDDFIEN